jgi:hypothetical protein
VNNSSATMYIMARISYIWWDDDDVLDYKIEICCLFAKYAALRRKSKDWLAWNQNNMSVWSDMSTCRLLFQMPPLFYSTGVLYANYLSCIITTAFYQHFRSMPPLFYSTGVLYANYSIKDTAIHMRPPHQANITSAIKQWGHRPEMLIKGCCNYTAQVITIQYTCRIKQWGHPPEIIVK